MRRATFVLLALSFFCSRGPTPALRAAALEDSSLDFARGNPEPVEGSLSSRGPQALGVPAGAAGLQETPRITRIEFSPAPEADGSGILIALLGSGQCTYTIDYGDGKTERRTATLPDRMRHDYTADKQYLVVATPDAPCEGVARAQLDIRAIARGIWKVSVEPGPATDAPEIIATVHGRGACAVLVSFGDGKQQKTEGILPVKVNHTYEKSGTYELHAVAAEPCRGEVRLSVDVRR